MQFQTIGNTHEVFDVKTSFQTRRRRICSKLAWSQTLLKAKPMISQMKFCLLLIEGIKIVFLDKKSCQLRIWMFFWNIFSKLIFHSNFKHPYLLKNEKYSLKIWFTWDFPVFLIRFFVFSFDKKKLFFLPLKKGKKDFFHTKSKKGRNMVSVE